MRRALPLLLVAALAALAAWVLWPSGSEDAAPDTKESAGNPSGKATQPEPGAAESPPTAEVERKEVAADSGESESDGGWLPPYEGEDALTVRVIDAFTGEPCSKATVLYARYLLLSDERRAEIREMDLGPREYMELVGDRYRTDAQGSVQVPPFERVCYLGATDGERFNRMYLREDQAGSYVELPLLPEVHLEILVRDDRDRPVPDMPVDLRWGDAGYSRGVQKEVSDAEGRVLLRHAQVTMTSERPDLDWAVALAIPLAEPIQQSIDLQELPPMPIVLRAPATGAIEFVLRDHAGKPVRENAYVVVQKIPEADSPVQIFGSGFSPLDALGATSARSDTGTMRLEHVGLGLQLEYGAMYPVAEDYERGELAGPTEPGQVLHVELQQQQAPRMVVGRVLQPDGTPLVDRDNVPMRVNHGWGSSGYHVNLDGEGVFHVLSRETPGESGPQRTAVLALPDPADASTILVDCRPYNGPLKEGEHDLGDFRLGGGRIVAGRVVDAEGAPVADAEVEVLWDLAMTLDHESRREFYTLQATLPATAEDGRFDFQGVVDGKRFRIRVRRDGFESLEIPVDRGAGNVEAVLTRTLRLPFELLLPDFLDPRELRVQATVDTGPGPNYGGGSTEWVRVPDGPDLLLGVTGGPLEFQVWGPAQALLGHVEGLAEAKDGERRDSRLLPLDLREGVREMHLEMGYDADAPPDRCTIFDSSGRSILGFSPRPSENPLPIRLLTTESPMEVTVYAQGYRLQPATLIHGQTAQVQMQPGIPVQVAFEVEGAAVSEDIAVKVTLHGTPRWYDQAASEAWEAVELTAGHDGEVQLAVRVTFEDSKTGHQHQAPLKFDGEYWLKFQLEDDGTPQRIVLPITAAAIEQARAQAFNR